MSGTPLLSLAIWVPILAGFVVLATGSDRNAPLARMLSLIGAVAGLLVTIPLYTGFDMNTPAMQFVELAHWIQRFNVNYHLGVDGISMLFVILNSFITVTVILAGWQVIDSKVAQYNAGFLIMSGLLNGIFSALDGVLVLRVLRGLADSALPDHRHLGRSEPGICSIQVLPLHALFGSLLFLIALLYLFVTSGGSFSILDWHRMPISLTAQTWLFLAFLVAFAVKVPMWPVHTWLPDAHVEAPTGGSIVLAAIALKLGAYGFPALLVADCAGRLARTRRPGHSAVADRDHLHRIRRPGAGRHEEARCLFVDCPYGFRDPRLLHLQCAGRWKVRLVQMISHGFVSGAMFFSLSA
jgi:NADH-quinone oxidoreductase subunit M